MLLQFNFEFIVDTIPSVLWHSYRTLIELFFRSIFQWESQHTNITCEQFANWQRDNNPELSKEAIGNYLQKNGIDCPKCKFKYDLSRYKNGVPWIYPHEMIWSEKLRIIGADVSISPVRNANMNFASVAANLFYERVQYLVTARVLVCMHTTNETVFIIYAIKL